MLSAEATNLLTGSRQRLSHTDSTPCFPYVGGAEGSRADHLGGPPSAASCFRWRTQTLRWTACWTTCRCRGMQQNPSAETPKYIKCAVLPTAAGGSASLSRCFAEWSFTPFPVLQADASQPRKGLRPPRCTGAAVAAAAALMESLSAAGGGGGRVLLLTGGPATLGPGQVVSRDLGDAIRTHKVREKFFDVKTTQLGKFLGKTSITNSLSSAAAAAV